MKKSTVILLGILICTLSTFAQDEKPRVFVFTDINIDQGDPDDRQSLVHLFWYANELTIEGVVPDRWNAEGYKACMLALEAYEKDYTDFGFQRKSFPAPSNLKKNIAVDIDHAKRLFFQAAAKSNTPLYVLIWGSMQNFGKILIEKPELHKNIRVITIGTDLMIEEYRKHIPEAWPKADKPCEQYNWNGFGRNEIFNDSRFNDMWWLEINWTYEGMFSGEEPARMFQKLSIHGHLGEHMIEVTKNQPWARYFRVGDTPSVLYVVDTDHNRDDPTESSWAGRFVKPFPDERPNYHMDDSGPVPWDYNNPCNTWENHRAMRDYAKSTLEKKRPEMYESLLKKLEMLYTNKYFQP